jgi:phasin family protein
MLHCTKELHLRHDSYIVHRNITLESVLVKRPTPSQTEAVPAAMRRGAGRPRKAPDIAPARDDSSFAAAPALTPEQTIEAVASAVPDFVEPAPVAAAPPVETDADIKGNETLEETLPEAAVQTAPDMSEGTQIMADTIESTTNFEPAANFAQDTKTKFENTFAEMNAKAKAGVEKSTRAIEELGALTKGNVEALVESGKIAAKGVEAIGQEAAEYSRKSFEAATTNLKSLASVKSPTEFFQLQSELLSSTFDAFARETAKNSEAILKLAGDVAQPISSRVSVVTDKVKALAA